ncbi:hypothetical protein GDO81_014806 [Engystomops pustulosus]|uniref:Methyltransferase domain-containing protein n=1 Tax=Engystomops pustulosus TaxID=76066 RepID=A0AAV7AJC5_ENGPU|nr:hypothetical protein GDO81_014806 [Engystomops pustulosus]
MMGVVVLLSIASLLRCSMSGIRIRGGSLDQNQRLAVNISRVLSLYGFITDSYIIEFFTDNLWEALPESWRSVLSDLTAPELADQLLSDSHPKTTSYRSVWPLSLLALKVTAQSLSFQRTPRRDIGGADGKRPPEFQDNHCQSSLLDPLFRKHVKPKKQHEIRRLGELVKKLSDVTRCDHVVDVGSGQGHLSRVLSFGQGLRVTAVEADHRLVATAAKYDHDLMYVLKKERTRPTKRVLRCHRHPLPHASASRRGLRGPPSHVGGVPGSVIWRHKCPLYTGPRYERQLFSPDEHFHPERTPCLRRPECGHAPTLCPLPPGAWHHLGGLLLYEADHVRAAAAPWGPGPLVSLWVTPVWISCKFLGVWTPRPRAFLQVQGGGLSRHRGLHRTS